METKSPSLKLIFLSILVYIATNMLVGVFGAIIIHVSSPYSILISLIPAVFVYQRYKGVIVEKKREINIVYTISILIIVGVIILLYR